jgi:hypothetical protein
MKCSHCGCRRFIVATGDDGAVEIDMLECCNCGAGNPIGERRLEETSKFLKSMTLNMADIIEESSKREVELKRRLEACALRSHRRKVAIGQLNRAIDKLKLELKRANGHTVIWSRPTCVFPWHEEGGKS